MLILAGMSLLTACTGTIKCEAEGRYVLSREGQRIQAPDDLDDLASYKELTIPRATPQPPQEDTGKCLEAPPAISALIDSYRHKRRGGRVVYKIVGNNFDQRSEA